MDVGPAIAIAGVTGATMVLGIVAAAETALERASDVRIHALASRGDIRAQRISGSVEQPRQFLGPLTAARVLSAGAIVALFAYIGVEPYGELKGALGFGAMGALYVAFIEMTVGLIAARQPEYAAIKLSEAVRFTGYVFAAPAFVLGLPSRLAARSLRGVTPRSGIDILTLVEREEAAGGVEEQESRMIRAIIDLEDRTAREIMTPRIDIAGADIEASVADVATLVNERGFSRIPVYRENIDDVVGIVFAKDLLRLVSNGGRDKKLAELLREPFFIPESKRLDELLTEMRSKRTHMAIVVDEYGGTAGLVTIEDLLEEIVGEIEDEYDVSSPGIEVISDHEVIVDAGLATDTLRELFDYEVESDDFDTLGGLLIHELGRLPSVGDEVTVDGLTLRVLSMSGRRIRRLRVAREPEREREEAASR